MIQPGTAPSSPLLLFWSNLHRQAPKLNIPGTNFNIGFTLCSAAFLSCIRLLMSQVFLHVLQWDPDNIRTGISTAYSVSIIHSIILCAGLSVVLYHQPYNLLAKLKDAPLDLQEATVALLEFCTGYMVYDFTFMLHESNWTPHPDDYAFLAHHVVTTLYMSQCKVLGVGHVSAMSLMLTGELTNPCQSYHAISRYGIQIVEDTMSWWHVLHPFAEWIYALAYFIVRGFVGPCQNMHITYVYLVSIKGRQMIPKYISIPWVVMIWGIILGSIPWTMEALDKVKDGLQVKYHKGYDYGPGFEL